MLCYSNGTPRGIVSSVRLRARARAELGLLYAICGDVEMGEDRVF